MFELFIFFRNLTVPRHHLAWPWQQGRTRMAVSGEDYEAGICASRSTEVADCVGHITTFFAGCHLTQCVEIWNLGFVARRIARLQRLCFSFESHQS